MGQLQQDTINKELTSPTCILRVKDKHLVKKTAAPLYYKKRVGAEGGTRTPLTAELSPEDLT